MVDAVDEGPRHVFEAVANNDEAAVKEFVEKRHVSLKNHDSFEQTVAHLAAKMGHLSILKYLLSKEAYLLTAMDGRNYTVFHRAAQQGGLAVVKYLMDEYKMDPLQPVGDHYGNSALHVAAEAGQLDVVKYFIEEKNMDANLKNAFQQPPAFSAALNKKLAIIQYLIEFRKADVTGVDIKNDNILFPTARRKDLKTARYLLDDRKLPFDINWRGHLGKTILYWSVRIQKTDFITYLVDDKNADIEIPDDFGWTPLHYASHVSNINAVKFLMQHKANFRAKDKDGRMPVDLARNFHVKNFLEGIAVRRGRQGRSVSVSDTLESHLERLMVAQPSAVGIENCTRPSFDDAEQVQLNTFFTLIGTTVMWLFKNYMTEKYVQRLLLLSSPRQMMQERLDPVAITVVNSNTDFEDYSFYDHQNQ